MLSTEISHKEDVVQMKNSAVTSSIETFLFFLQISRLPLNRMSWYDIMEGIIEAAINKLNVMQSHQRSLHGFFDTGVECFF